MQSTVTACHTAQSTVTPSAPRRVIFLDTETMGFFGLPFLIQARTGAGGDVEVIHVLDRRPSDVAHWVRELVAGQTVLVCHNAMFDLSMLAKLLTVAEMVSDWSFASIWTAERIWRGEVTYDERLGHLKLVYPFAVEDTLIAAQSLPPLREMFMRPVTARCARLPVPIIPQLEAVLTHALNRRPFYSPRNRRLNLAVGDWLRYYVEGNSNRKDRQRTEAAQACEDFGFQREVRFTITPRNPYSLKHIARVLGYPEDAHEFDFLNDFGRIRLTEPCPTYRDRAFYELLYNYTRQHQHDDRFIEYAKRDVDMLEFVHTHYAAQAGYENLLHDFGVLPLMANLRLYGVHVDRGRVAATQALYRQRVDDSRAKLTDAGLANFNSWVQVVRFVNRLLRENLRLDQIEEMDPVKDMREDTLNRVLRVMTATLGDDHGAAVTMGHIVRARAAAKRTQFFERVVGDTLYPVFHVKGTQTDRMTSTRPAIQTIPKPGADDDDDASNFRSAFTPPSGYATLVGDFDQFEMRLMAAVAGETHLMDAFDQENDTHAVTAMRTMGPEIRKLNRRYAVMSDDDLVAALAAKEAALKVYRGRGKVLNFAISYGASQWGIARLAGIPVDEAKKLIAAFHKAYPALSSDIKKTHARLSVLGEQVGMNGYPYAVLQHARSTQVTNRIGMVRCFDLPLRLIEILMKLAEANDIYRYLPILDGHQGQYGPYYDEDKTPDQVVRSQLRSAARKLQNYIHRQAYNFRIQSLGAYYTKELQTDLARVAIPSGVHRACDLSALPGINVHDEIHMYVRGDATPFIDRAADFTRRVSAELRVPIKFEFNNVASWADKS